jgi:hypothetical protein
MALKRRDVVSIIVLLVAVGLLVLVILGMSGTVDLCKAGAKRKRGGGKKSSKKAAKKNKAEEEAAAAAAGADSEMEGKGKGGANGVSLLAMEGPAAVEALKERDPQAVLFVLGQASCPACQACKKYLGDNNHGDVSLFVDIGAHPAMLKDGSLPKPVVDSLGRGVPCMVAWNRKGKGKLGSKEGFSPKAVEELIALVRQA